MNSKNLWQTIILLVVVAAGVLIIRGFAGNSKSSQTNNQPVQPSSTNPTIPSKGMKVTSPAFAANSAIPLKYSCEGQNINPEIDISGVPAAAKSLAFVLHDPDAPVQGGFTHWVMFNIDPKTVKIGEHSVPKGAVQGSNGAGQQAYTGPCPPSGMHHYHFIVYALNSTLTLDKSATKGTLEQAMIGHVLDDAELIGTYQKQK